MRRQLHAAHHQQVVAGKRAELRLPRHCVVIAERHEIETAAPRPAGKVRHVPAPIRMQRMGMKVAAIPARTAPGDSRRHVRRSRRHRLGLERHRQRVVDRVGPEHAERVEEHHPAARLDRPRQVAGRCARGIDGKVHGRIVVPRAARTLGPEHAGRDQIVELGALGPLRRRDELSAEPGDPVGQVERQRHVLLVVVRRQHAVENDLHDTTLIRRGASTGTGGAAASSRPLR